MRVLFLCFLCAVSCAFAADWSPLYRTEFSRGIDVMVQAPARDCVSVVPAPGGRAGSALRVTLRRTDEFRGVANGVPRAELSFAPRFRMRIGQEYRLRWSTYIPPDYRFDSQQPEGISQIHPGPAQATPAFGLTLIGDRYRADVRAGARVVRQADVGSAAADRGRWVDWSVRYRPDPNGGQGVFVLSRDGATVLDASGQPNAWPGDNDAYFKYGIYKWDWQRRNSDVTERTIYFSDLVAEQTR